MKRTALAALMAILAINVWTGGPVLALWIGSRIQTHSKTSMTLEPITAVAVVAALAVISVVLVKSLGAVSAAYDRASGISPAGRKHDSWVSVERRSFPGDKLSLTMLERILVLMVTAAALAFEVWFFFYSTSPIDGRSGRSAVPLARASSPTVSTCASPRRRKRSPIASAASRLASPAPICTLNRPSSVQ
jgi:hypothetical protein